MYRDNRREFHGKQPDGSLSTQTGYFTELSKQGDGTWIDKFKNDSQFRFNANGLISAIRDRNGHQFSLLRDPQNVTTSIRDDVSGRQLFTDRDAQGRITQVRTDPVGGAALVWVLTYNANSQLDKMCDPRGGKIC